MRNPDALRGRVVVTSVAPDHSVCKRVLGTTVDLATRVQWEATLVESSVVKDAPTETVLSQDWRWCVEQYPRPAAWLWLEGDNGRNSCDSRQCGAVPLECVRGVVLGRFWPTLARL